MVELRKSAIPAVMRASKGTRRLDCGFTEYIIDGKKAHHVNMYRIDVLNAKLAFLPEAKLSLGFDKATNCEEARKAVEFMNEVPSIAELFDNAPQDPVSYKPDSGESAPQIPLRKAGMLGGTA